MDILIATNNKHKVTEFARILSGYRVLCPGDIGLAFDFDETGSTFLENAFGKAMALHTLTRQCVLADDSGLCVKALDNAPGVYSARYGSANGAVLSAAEKNALLLDKLKGCSQRQAYFVCCMVLVFTEQRFFAAQETLEGEIAQTPAGDNGFGYDPVFYVPEFRCTVAELGDTQKDRISHRGKAARVIKNLLAAE